MDTEIINKKSLTEKQRNTPLAVPVYVQCNGARFLAYRDKEGNWRYFYNQEPVKGSVKLIPYSPI
jgi:hypothetical protein